MTSVFAAACSSEDPPPAGGGPIPIESVREELEKASCEFSVRCGLMPDQATCLDLAVEDPDLLQLLADVVFDKVTFDPAVARTCVDTLTKQGCEALSSSVETACKGVFKGSVAVGGACVVNDECAGDSTCDTSFCSGEGACCIGVCTAKPVLIPLGGDCMEASCVETAYCEKETDEMGAVVSATCESRVQNGQPCKSVDACEAGLRCDTGGDDNCYVLSKEGQQCNPNLKNGGCLRTDNWCSTADKKCVRLPGAGEPCTDDGKCLEYAYCDMAGMTCKSRPLEGEDCVQDGPRCLGELFCEVTEMKGVCKRPNPKAVCVIDDAVPPTKPPPMP